MTKLSFDHRALLLLFFLSLSSFFFFQLGTKPLSRNTSNEMKTKICHSKGNPNRNNNHTVSTFIPNKRKFRPAQFIQQQPNHSKYKKTFNKIAILWNGSVRTFGQVFYFLRNEFLAFNEWPDLYISMVYQDDREKMSFDSVSSMLKNVMVARVEKFDLESLKARARKVYSHFPFTRTECQHLFTIEKCNNWVSSMSLIRDSFEDMKKHNDMMKEKLQLNRDYYDIVVRLRSDVLFENRVDLLKFKIDENTLYTPLVYNWGGVNDQVSFGSMKVMDSMSQLFFEIENIMNDNKAMLHPETFLSKFLFS